jgi:Cys-rich protein (TIGR01571 family)
MSDRTQQWRTGCLSCMVHTPSCIDGLLCYPCFTGRLCMLAQDPPQVQTQSILHCLCSIGLEHLYACQIRQRLAERYKIEEGCIVTTCVSCLCPCCSNMQVQREASFRKEWTGPTFMENQPWDGNI